MSIDQGVGNVTGLNGVSVKAAATTTWTLTASNAGGSVTRTATATLASVGITLDADLTPTQLFHFGHPDAMGLFNVPDMHTAFIQLPDHSYRLWITGNVGPSNGSIARLATTDFLAYQNAGPGTATAAAPVMGPSCDGATASCMANPDADYVGANAVLAAANGTDLLMLYEAGNQSIGGAHRDGWEYNVMSVARSADGGLTWARSGPGLGPFLSGPDPKPTAPGGNSQPGISEPGAIAAGGYLYLFYQYVPNLLSEPESPSVIQVARAPVAADGAPGTWTKYANGAWSEPGLGGRGSTIVAIGPALGCTRPVQVWPVFSTYLDAFVLLFLANEGWFFTTSTDLLTWAPPTLFMPMAMFQDCQPMSWNYVLATPGNRPGEIGQTGYVLYAHTDRKNCPGDFQPHELWVRSFRFTRTP